MMKKESMKSLVLSVLVALIPSAAMAAGELDLKGITRGFYRAETLSNIMPTADGESYIQLNSDGKRIVKYSFQTGQEQETLFDAATAKGDELKRIDGYVVSPDGRRLLLQTNTQQIYRRSLTADYYLYNIQNKKLVPLSKNGPQQAPVFSPDGNVVAFVRDGNIFLVKLLYDNAESQVTKDGKRGEVLNGIPDWVCEEEFSTDRAMTFTADSKQLVWVRYDESKVPLYGFPLYKGLQPERTEMTDYPGTFTYKYPVAGADNARQTVWSFDISSRQTRQLQVPVDEDGYVPRLIATADASRVLAVTLNRHQDCLRVYGINPLSTVSQLLIEDKTDKYVKEDCITQMLVSEKYILLPSQRDGWMHFYLYNTNGQLLRQVEKGDYDVSRAYGVDDATGDVFYAAQENKATDQRVYVARANSQKRSITDKAGWNTAVFSANYKYFVHTWSNLNTPPVVSLCTADGKPLSVVNDNHQLAEKLSRKNLGQRELFYFTTSEGTLLNGWMVKPAGFDATKRYPVVMYLYGGPGNQQVRDAWDIGMMGQGAILEQYLCQQGFICVCVDGRGTGGRGANFEKSTYLNLGKLEAIDQVEAALWLGKQPYVDREKIGIWGWSFGGFLTLMSMSEGRGVFRAGVAIAPVTSWRYYDSVYAERYMRTPKENPSGYDFNPISIAYQLKGALLLCHGSADDNVHLRNQAEYAEALVQADKDFEQLVYTNRNHSIYGGNTRNHLFRQCTRFFERELK